MKMMMIMEPTYVQDSISYYEEDLDQCWINVIMFIVSILPKIYKHPYKFRFQNRLVTRPVRDSMVQGQVISLALSQLVYLPPSLLSAHTGFVQHLQSTKLSPAPGPLPKPFLCWEYLPASLCQLLFLLIVHSPGRPPIPLRWKESPIILCCGTPILFFHSICHSLSFYIHLIIFRIDTFKLSYALSPM